MASNGGWSRPFDEPMSAARDRALVTLQDDLRLLRAPGRWQESEGTGACQQQYADDPQRGA